MRIIMPKTLSFYRDGLAYSISYFFVRNNSLHQSPQERLCLDRTVQMGQGIVSSARMSLLKCYRNYRAEHLFILLF